MSINNTTVVGNEHQNVFLVELNNEGKVENIGNYIVTDERAINDLSYDDGNLIIAGSINEISKKSATEKKLNVFIQRVDVDLSRPSDRKDDESFSIFPNPNRGIFTVAFDEAASDDKRSIKIMDVSGKLIHEATVKQGTKSVQIVIPNRTSGVYNVQLVTGDIAVSKKMVIY